MVSRKKPAKKAHKKKSLSRKRFRLSRVQALVVAVVLAVVGLFVVLATEASGTPSYQYSWSAYCNSSHGSSSESEVQTCKDNSAEALVYRLYRGLYERNPDSGGYAFWTQKLAGERVKPVELGLVTDRVSKMGSDAAFVNALYKNVLGRNPRGKEASFWTKRLAASGSKKWSRQQVAIQFSTSSEALRVNRSRFNQFAATAPKVSVVQVAAQDQRQRFDAMLSDYQQPNKTYMNSVADLAKKSATERDKAKYIASKKAPSASDLKAIADQKSAIEGYYGEVSAKAETAKANSQAAGRLYSRAVELAQYAKDIARHSVYGINKIQARYKATLGYETNINNYYKSIGENILQATNYYTLAEQKYKDEQQRLAQEAAKKQSSSGGSGGGSGSSGSSNSSATPAARGQVKITKILPEGWNSSWCILSKTAKSAEYRKCLVGDFKRIEGVAAKVTKSGSIKACGVFRAERARKTTAFIEIYKAKTWLTPNYHLTNQNKLAETKKQLIPTGDNVAQNVCTKDIKVQAGQVIEVYPSAGDMSESHDGSYWAYFNSLTIN